MRSWAELAEVMRSRRDDWAELDTDELVGLSKADLLLEAARWPLFACASTLRLRLPLAAVVVCAPLRSPDGRVTVEELAASWAPWVGWSETFAESLRESVAAGLLSGDVRGLRLTQSLGASVVRPGPRLVPLLERNEARQKLERFPW